MKAEEAEKVAEETEFEEQRNSDGSGKYGTGDRPGETEEEEEETEGEESEEGESEDEGELEEEVGTGGQLRGPKRPKCPVD